jgi:hypothetical protein
MSPYKRLAKKTLALKNQALNILCARKIYFSVKLAKDISEGQGK